MNASMGIYRDETDVSYAVDFGRDREPTTKRSRHPDYRRKGSAPARVNGMHCRRNWTPRHDCRNCARECCRPSAPASAPVASQAKL